MLNKEQGTISHHIAVQQKLYLDYALAAEAYAKKSTMDNWEKKERAFERYNDFFSVESNFVEKSAA